jgi:acyl-CoA reductase-like NAD-dependent aldehyde dehydrogenase
MSVSPEATLGRRTWNAPSDGAVAFTWVPTDSVELGPALDRARAAQEAWAALGTRRRGDILGAAAVGIRRDDRLATVIAVHVGKPIAEARAEVERSARILEMASGLADRPVGELFEDSAGSPIRVLRVPRGVVACITPWNFPAAIPVWKLAPALLAGNAVLLKMIDLGVDAISFTGSDRAGRAVIAAAGRQAIPAQVEMGGKNAVIVGRDADPALAVSIVLAGAMGYAGQKCTATSRVFVPRELEQQMLAALKQQTTRIAAGDPLQEGLAVGPMISQEARDRVSGLLDGSRNGGVEVVASGHVLGDTGAYLAPIVLAGGPPQDPIYRDELFAPVLAVSLVDDLDEALAELRAMPQGLVCGVVSSDRPTVERVVREAPVGLIRINAPTTGLEPHVAFGGHGTSSFGPAEQGAEGLRFFSQLRTAYG